MYALHDATSAVGTAPLVQAPAGPAQQIERRAVESTEQGSLESEGRYETVYSSTAALLQLVRGSAETFAEMLDGLPENADTNLAAENAEGNGPPRVDLYA